MSSSHTAVHIRYVFATKGREPVLSDAIRPRLWAYLGGVARREGATTLEVGGAADHVHLLLTLGRTHSSATLMRALKARSSVWLHRTFPTMASFSWQTGYGAFSVSLDGLDAVRAYIRGQERHHARESFEEEYVAFLRRHGLDYDEEYLWK